MKSRCLAILTLIVVLENVCGHDENYVSDSTEHEVPGYVPKDYVDNKPSHYQDVPRRPYPPNQQQYDYGYEEEGCFRYPANCKAGYNCEFEASWESDILSNDVYFIISARLPKGYWAGIGFSDDRSMVGSDGITGWITSGGGLVLQDRYLAEKSRFSVPVDRYSDVSPTSYYHQDGMMEYRFKRRRNTYDIKDKNLEKCVYFLFAWGGEGLVTGEITVHKKQFVSKNIICLGSIHGDIGTSVYSSSSEPKYEYLRRPMEYHYDPCRRKTICRKNELCIRKGPRATCKCPYGYNNKPEGCIEDPHRGFHTNYN
uniref:uncharacterized protein LOC120336492 n=1 Tax=Styela clava TaxID=7725 RepID=UPI0019397174|nr:uncharacterized protein LOC120336492 [Styela clava]